MATTLALEELPPDTRRLFEDLLNAGAPVIVSRAGQPFGGMIAYAAPGDAPAALTPAERADLAAVVAQGESDYAAGRYTTLDAFKERHASRLREADETEETGRS